MALTLSTFDPVLKDFWEPGIKEQLNNDIPLWRVLETADKEWSGRRVIYPIHTTRNAGVAARAEAATLPTAGNQGHELAVVSATYQYGAIQLTGQTIEAGKHAWAAALEMEMSGLVKDCKNDWGRQTWGTGDGRLAQIGVSSTAATGSVNVLVQNRFQRAGQPGARYISVGNLLDIGSLANGGLGISQTISAVAVSTNPATIQDTVTLGNSAVAYSSSEQFFYVQGVGTTAGVGREIMGVLGIVDVFTEANMWGSNAFWSAALFGINRSAVGAWNANVLGNSGVTRKIDSYLMEQCFDQIHQDTGEDADLIMGHHSVVRALFDSLVADRRYASTVYEGGFSKLSYNGVPVEKDRMGPFNTLLVAKRSALAKFTLKEPGWIQRDGAILRTTDRTDRYEGWFSYYGNLGVVGNMKSLLMLRDIKTDL